jgi:uncharacterized protein YbjT (DUF2867 family)
MKIVVIGGSGLVGTQLVERLESRGHEVVAGSPSLGIDTLSGEGVPEALAGAEVVVDVSNSSSLDGEIALDFFARSSRNLLAAEVEAGVRHHLALSVTGTDRLQQSGYFRAKKAQENLIIASPMPYTILHSTQFFEFIEGIVEAGTRGDEIHVSPAYIQPVASADVAMALADLAVTAPAFGIVEVTGPERYRLDDLAKILLAANEDPRQVVADTHARYFGAELDDRSLIPGDHPRFAPTEFVDWLRRR